MQLSDVCSVQRMSVPGVYWEGWDERLVSGREGRLGRWWVGWWLRMQGGLECLKMKDVRFFLLIGRGHSDSHAGSSFAICRQAF